MENKTSLREPSAGKRSALFPLPALLLLALAAALLFWKCGYGPNGDDEPFYLTVAHRLTLGDHLFRDEWHLSQLLAYLVYPFVKLYRAVNGSMDGVILTWRRLYVLGHSAVCLLLYFGLRKRSEPGALTAALLFQLFAPFNMMDYSYNTFALDLLALTGLLLSGERLSRAALLLAGFFFAAAVVCCPYLVLLYLLFALGILGLYVCRKRIRADLPDGLRPAAFGFFTLGVTLQAALFLVFFFRHSSLSELLAALPHLFNDPEHPSHSALYYLKHYVYVFLTARKALLPVFGLYALSLLALLADKKRASHAAPHLGLAALTALGGWFLLRGCLLRSTCNYIELPFLFIGFTSFCLLRKKPWSLFLGLFLPGLVYSFCVNTSSNQEFMVITMAFSVCHIAGVLFLFQLLREQREAGARTCALQRGMAALVCLTFLGLLLTTKILYNYWDADTFALDRTLTDGPYRGITVSEEVYEYYNTMLTELKAYGADCEAGNLLVYGDSSQPYLILDGFAYGTYSAWVSPLGEDSFRRLLEYYESNPEKTPRYVYIVKAGLEEVTEPETVAALAARYGYRAEETDFSWWLTKAE